VREEFEPDPPFKPCCAITAAVNDWEVLRKCLFKSCLKWDLYVHVRILKISLCII